MLPCSGDSCPQVEVLIGLRDSQGGSQGGSGVTYTRWGRTTCPSDQGTEVLYSGRAAGSPLQNSGGGANYICLPEDPDYLPFQSGVQGYSHVTGVQYAFYSVPGLSYTDTCHAPCAVCYTPSRSAEVMIPANTQCPGNWTVEYVGYLMSEWKGRSSRTMFVCVDKDPEIIPGLCGVNPPNIPFHLVEAHCNLLPCPPYDAEKELACVVCTR